MCFVGSLARFGGYRGSTSLSTPRAPGWVTFFATAARPRNIHLDRALGGCQHERNINGRAGRGPVSIFLTNRRESLHQQQSPAPRALLLTRQASVNGTLVQTSLVGRLWRISAKCALSKCLTLGVHSTRLRLLRVRLSRPFTRISLSEREVHSLLALISGDRPTTLLRATVRSQLLERCAPSRAG